MREHAVSRRKSETGAHQLNHFATMEELDTLLAKSDNLSMTLPFSYETEELFNVECFAAMKPTGISLMSSEPG